METMMKTLPASHMKSTASLADTLKRYPLAAFFTLAYLGSWIVWLPMLLAGNNLLLPSSAVSPGLKFLLIVLAPFAGPTLAAFVMTAALEGRAGVRALLGRYVQWRFGLPWYLIVLGGPLLLLMLVVAAFYGKAALPPLGEQGLNIIVAYLVTLVVNLFIGGILGEEPGWRGFALPRLQARFGALTGSMILALFWSLWHLPLILTPGGATWTGSIALYIVLNVALTIVHTWVFNGTRSSLLGVLLLHAAVNTSTRLILPNIPGLSRDEGNLLLVVAYGAVALLLVVLTKGRLAARLRNHILYSTRTDVGNV
jgi:membrane protease YdiL (CAAX protease family)